MVVGDIMLDQYLSGDVSRVSPEAPVPIINVNEHYYRLGGAANVALNIKSLGVDVVLLGFVGDDLDGQILTELLQEKGIANDLVVIPGETTIKKIRVIGQNQQLVRLDYDGKYENDSQNVMIQKYRDMLATVDVVVLSDYAKGALDQSMMLIDAAKSCNVPVLVDPKGNDYYKYSGATILTPNKKEFEFVVGSCSNANDFIEKGMDLIKRHGYEALLVTLGSEGMLLLTVDGLQYNVTTRAKEVADVTGAGDTVIGVLAACYSAKLSLTQSVEISNLAAGIVVGKMGTSVVTVVEIQDKLSSYQDELSGVVEEHTLLNVVAQARSRGEAIVMTNGCFDLLHPGHVEYLRKARQLGDRLIVAVNDSDSVRRLKGPSRPLNSLEHRMLVLAGLKSVDWVVSFGEDTPERLIDVVKPDVLVKGGDYTEDQISGAKSVRDAGGQVEIIPLREGCSTTNIVGRILKQASDADVLVN